MHTRNIHSLLHTRINSCILRLRLNHYLPCLSELYRARNLYYSIRGRTNYRSLQYNLFKHATSSPSVAPIYMSLQPPNAISHQMRN